MSFQSRDHITDNSGSPYKSRREFPGHDLDYSSMHDIYEDEFTEEELNVPGPIIVSC